MRIILAVSVCLLVAVGCSHKTKDVHEEKAVQTAANVKGTEYKTITFTKGQKSLSAINRKELQDLAQKAQMDGRKIDEIKILAWGDKNHPTDKTATKGEIDLAEARAENVKKYLEEGLQAKADIDQMNMAEKPSMWDDMIKNDEYKTKTEFQGPSHASKALVIYEYAKP